MSQRGSLSGCLWGLRPLPPTSELDKIVYKMFSLPPTLLGSQCLGRSSSTVQRPPPSEQTTRPETQGTLDKTRGQEGQVRRNVNRFPTGRPICPAVLLLEVRPKVGRGR